MTRVVWLCQMGLVLVLMLRMLYKAIRFKTSDTEDWLVLIVLLLSLNTAILFHIVA